MSIPVGSNCPQGLEYLTVLDQLLVSQKIEKLEILTSFETKNRFKVKNSLGQNVYFAYEESDCCTRNCLGRARPFEMKILDNFQNEVLHLNRPFRCNACCCFPSCQNILEVSAPPGQVIGTVEQVCTFTKPKFVIKNSFGDVVLHIKGPYCPWKCFSDSNMKVSVRARSSNNLLYDTGIHIYIIYTRTYRFGCRQARDDVTMPPSLCLTAIFSVCTKQSN